MKEEQDKLDEIEIKETYPIEVKEKKLRITAILGMITWDGAPYHCATPEFSWCCDEIEIAFGREIGFQGSNTAGRNPAYFAKLLYNGNPVDKCPFCGAEVEINPK